jgi:hypothetical protein
LDSRLKGGLAAEGDSMVIDPKMLMKGYGSGFKDWNFSFSRD